MTILIPQSSHTFHIPVMGTGFTIDTPLRVAKYGISSVISMVDDTLIEQMRKFHCEKAGLPYQEIPDSDDNARALRITGYLNLLDSLVAQQVTALQGSPFDPGSEITRYFELLPDSPLKQDYLEMLSNDDPQGKQQQQEALRSQAIPGSIDINIMTKSNREKYRGTVKLAPEFSDAMAAMRGYADSTLNSSLILSAGMNPKIYSYLGTFDDFFPDEDGHIKKKIILKVSDYRSAIIQGKFLAKRGIWVAEYRIESGLNCGGHAFAIKGELMGPILEEFKIKKDEITKELHPVYNKALAAGNRPTVWKPLDLKITVQGGVGTAAEHNFLLDYYNVESVGWCTPFLLVPEVANVDEVHLKKLAEATAKDVLLTRSSPLGVLYWNLQTSASEQACRDRIAAGKPGTTCPKRHVAFNTEFTEIPICTSSRAYQKLKLEDIEKQNYSPEQLEVIKADVLAKICICHELGGSVKILHGIDPDATPTVCCGPGIVDFSKVASLEEMIGHIYGKNSLLTNPDRPHMFVRELQIYLDDLCNELHRYKLDLSFRTAKYFAEFKENLLGGIDYYRQLANELGNDIQHKFLDDINGLCAKLMAIASPE
ncbi:MAG: hypothetical protein JEZ07_11025 [Phycisphaerae bacterium]|nr:hypothetical protein [Phycisphaerae bacterium]